MKPGTVLSRLYNHLEPAAKNQRIADLRIGLSYVGVKLDSGSVGLAAVLPDTRSKGCTVLKEAGTLAGSNATDLLKYLVEGKNVLHRAMGLAAANALIAPLCDKHEDREATTLFDFQPGEKVTMVGLFAPLVDRIRATGAVLTILEKNPDRLEILSPHDQRQALNHCDVAIITATTLLNNTFEETIGHLGTPRVVALMGPSTPLTPGVFQNTQVTHLGGSVVADCHRVCQIISEGGGTPALRPFLRFVNMRIKQSEAHEPVTMKR